MTDEKMESIDNGDAHALLNRIEARILGALMEKELTTPENYPLTLNSLTLACNQKSSRDPQMKLSQGEVGNCVRQLQRRELVSIESGSRADRYAHKLRQTLKLDKAARAVLNIMMLRGPQTLNELLVRSQRMAQFEDAAAIERILDALARRDEPLVQKIPRQSGQREDRYMHLLCGKLAMQEHQSELITDSAANTDLEARVDELEKQVAVLIKQVGLKNDSG